ncbi:hypothetical protein VTP01DRAFT_4223, partial [Rhizomucor pusillus]|uniref:uncharacterized protein n=1 Tax=Rhizomucor pusillus TaxID=4840 RepID=UPI003744A523
MSLRKDLHYSLGKIKADVCSRLAKQNPLQTPDTKALSLWIYEERNDLAALRLSAYHQQETRKAFLSWIEEEGEDGNEDIQNIGEKLAALMEKQQEIDNEYIS